jgi:peptidylprolyl isomerase
MAADLGQTVRFHFTGRLSDGSVFGSTEDQDPIQTTLGQGEVLPPIDAALVGMDPGEEKTVEVASEEAYGPHRPELVQQVGRERIPDDVKLSVGDRLGAQGPDGQPVELTVVEFDDQTVTLDANHPLAGRDLTFDIKLVELA